MRAFITGATGFIGGRVVRLLRDRGDDVVALVRSPHKAGELRALDCELVAGGLDARAVMRDAMTGCDVAFHLAAMYKVGVTRAVCAEMHVANVDGTRHVLETAHAAGVPNIVYVSTVGTVGNTRGEVVDETFPRVDLEWLTCYDETKYAAHQVARELIAAGAPVSIAMPGGVYGPGDTSDLRRIFELARKGWAKVLLFPETGFNFVHVDDVAEGILLVADKGKAGEEYVLGGELTTTGDLIKKISTLSGHKPPTRAVPPAVIKASVPLWSLIARAVGLPPNLRELIRAGHGVTYWASDAKARAELGYSPRPLDEGLEQTLREWV